MMNDAVNQLLASWGWRGVPPPSVVSFAEQTIAHNPDGTKPVGQLVVDLGHLSADDVSQALKTKPADMLFLAYLAQQHPRMQAVRSQVLAIKNRLPYYQQLPSDIAVHPLLEKDSRAREQCVQLNALLVTVENTTPLLLFADPDQLIRYRQQGASDQMRDAVLAGLTASAGGKRYKSNDLLYGLARGADIQSLLRALKSANGNQAERGNANRLFYLERTEGDERRLAVDMLETGIQRGASDLSLSILESGEGEIHYRENTKRLHSYTISMEERIALTNFLLQISGGQTSGAILREPAGGRIFYGGNHGPYEMRCSFIPYGNHDAISEADQRVSISMRYLPQDTGDSSVDIEALGFDPDVLRHLQAALHVSEGIVLLVGPTNSGKSTTIAGFIGQHYKAHGDTAKRLSLEDPKERTIKGVEQFSLRDASKYENYLEAFLRHDPDVILISEIRSAKTAEVATRAALTGHLVLSTFHAPTPIEGYTALAHLMNEDRQYDLLQSLLMIVAQRLLPKLCNSCKVQRAPTEREWAAFEYGMRLRGKSLTEFEGTKDQLFFPRPGGCNDCNKSGYKGMLAVHGVLDFTREVKSRLLRREYEEAEKLEAFSLSAQALKALRRGDISIEEVAK